MSVIQLSTKIHEQVDETTTSDAIAYIPGGLGVMKAATSKILKQKARKKKKWGVTVVEDAMTECVELRFDDHSGIGIRRDAWEEFRQAMNLPDLTEETVELDLSSYLMEAEREDLAQREKELKNAFYELLVRKPQDTIDYHVAEWLERFGVTEYLANENTLIQYQTLEQDIDKAVGMAIKAYQDDLGTLEQITQALKEGRPITTFEPFQNYQYLIGSKVTSTYKGVVMTLTAYVDMSAVPYEQIKIESDQVADDIDSVSFVKVTDNIVYPKGKTFDEKIFRILQSTIEENT